MRYCAQVHFLRLGQPWPEENHQSLPLTKWTESDWLFKTELALPDSRELLMESGSPELETGVLAWKWTPNLGAKSRCALVNPNPQLQEEAFGYWVPHIACFVLTFSDLLSEKHDKNNIAFSWYFKGRFQWYFHQEHADFPYPNLNNDTILNIYFQIIVSCTEIWHREQHFSINTHSTTVKYPGLKNINMAQYNSHLKRLLTLS